MRSYFDFYGKICLIGSMRELLFVFVGGGTGSVLRYLVGRWFDSVVCPWGTFAVNIVGCFLIGLLGTWIARHSLPVEFRLLLIVGLCGGFTTFSTFSNEALTMMRSGQLLQCLVYVSCSIVAGFAATYLGARLMAP